MVLATRLRDGRSSRSGNPITAAHIRDEIHAVSKGFTDVGLPDPRHTSAGQMDPRLTNLVRAWSKQDPPPKRVKPLAMDILHHAQALASATPCELTRATIDMGWLAFFFLLRPGEYCKPTDSSAPLLFRHLGLTIGHQKLNLFMCSLNDIRAATHASVFFDT